MAEKVAFEFSCHHGHKFLVLLEAKEWNCRLAKRKPFDEEIWCECCGRFWAPLPEWLASVRTQLRQRARVHMRALEFFEIQVA